MSNLRFSITYELDAERFHLGTIFGFAQFQFHFEHVLKERWASPRCEQQVDVHFRAVALRVRFPAVELCSDDRHATSVGPEGRVRSPVVSFPSRIEFLSHDFQRA